MAEIITLGSTRTPELKNGYHDANGFYHARPQASDLPNFLSRPLTLLDKILWLPLASGMAWIKRLLIIAAYAVVLGLAAVGSVALYFAYQYRNGHISAYVLNGDEYQYFGRPANFQIEQSLEIPASKTGTKESKR